MSKLPFVALFNYLVGMIAPEFFDSGLPCLETGTVPPYIILYHPSFVDGSRLSSFHVIFIRLIFRSANVKSLVFSESHDCACHL